MQNFSKTLGWDMKPAILSSNAAKTQRRIMETGRSGMRHRISDHGKSHWWLEASKPPRI